MKEIENPFQHYRNKHKNRRAILFGSGPSILNFDKQKIPDDILRFGVNDQIFLDLDLDYWFMGDAMPQNPAKFYNRFKDYDDYNPKIQKFVRICGWQDERIISVPGWGSVPRTGQLPLNMKNTKYYHAHAGGNPDTCTFKKDLGAGSLSCVASISFEILQFILFCGIKEIFLVGHDCDYSSGTFAKFMIGRDQRAGYWISRYWKVVKPWIEENHPEVKIFSVNPVALNIFPEITLQEITQRENAKC